MKLALGTAQFGMNYGINNSVGQVSQENIQSILKYAKLKKIRTVDTAISYGTSEVAIGAEDLNFFNVITKLPSVPSDCKNIQNWILREVKESLRRLNLDNIYGLMLHDTDQLRGQFGVEIIKALEVIKISGLVKKIGISVYHPVDFDILFSFYDFDLVQCPFNLVDRRLITSGWLKKLKDRNIEVHTRSCFLQGLLIMNKENIPNKFNKWEYLWKTWHEWLVSNSISPVQACLDYVASFPEIDNYIVGVETIQQFKEIVAFSEVEKLDDYPNISCNDLKLINPSSWSKL